MPLEPISDVNPGDVILVHGTTWLGALIRFFLRMRFRCTEERRFAHWSHAALVVGPKGQIVEVLARGVVLRELRRYKDDDCLHISVDLSAADRSKAVGFAVARLRQRYGALGFLLLTFALLFRDRFRVGDFGQQGCAVLIARALQQAGMSFERRPVEMPSRPGEFHPEPLTEPDLTLSRHPARATARRLPPSIEHRVPPVAG